MRGSVSRRPVKPIQFIELHHELPSLRAAFGPAVLHRLAKMLNNMIHIYHAHKGHTATA